MKILIVAHIVFILIYGCGLMNDRDAIEDFIPGTYIRFSQHEFGHEYDTLMITLQNKSAGEYSILRKWKYERMLDGEMIEPEYKQKATSGIYDPSRKLLEESETGNLLSFDVKGRILFNGSTKYQKL